MRKGIGASVVVVLLVGLLLAFWETSSVAIGDGGFEVDVQIACDVGKITSICCVPFWNRNDADEAVRQLFVESPFIPFGGESIKVPIHSVTRWRPSGRTISRGYERYLVVLARLADGRPSR